jgi:hypothetical protein
LEQKKWYNGVDVQTIRWVIFKEQGFASKRGPFPGLDVAYPHLAVGASGLVGKVKKNPS